MDQNIALEALSALTGCMVRPAGGASDDASSRGGIPAFISGGKRAEPRDFVQNELTPENLFSTTFINEKLPFPKLLGGAREESAPQNSRDDAAALRNLLVNRNEFFSPEYDHDFRQGKDSSKCSRGNEPYHRPWGWYRFALNIDKYGDKTWLGSPGPRNKSSDGEWPVSFHGTTREGAAGITGEFYRPGPRERHGYGIYSTPTISVAENKLYAKTFKSETDNKTYKVVMQNRINPEKRTIVKREKGDYWIIEMDYDASPEEEEKKVKESIRPYGILIKEVK